MLLWMFPFATVLKILYCGKQVPAQELFYNGVWGRLQEKYNTWILLMYFVFGLKGKVFYFYWINPVQWKLCRRTCLLPPE